MKIEWNRVTWYSKSLAVLVLIAAVALAWHFAREYQELREQDRLQANLSFGGLADGSGFFSTALDLKPQTIKLATGASFNLNMPGNYSISVAAQGFRHARFMAFSPDHRLFLGEMADAGDTSTGRVIILDNFDQASGSFNNTNVYLSNLRNPNSVGFYTEPSGKQWIYIALTDKLIRYPYAPGDNAPSGQQQVVATFPASGQSPKNGGWHLTRTIVVHNDKLYISVGSSCNSCEETEAIRGVILEMNPDGSAEKIIASGLRNAVGLVFADNQLYATANEADHLGPDRPEDLVYRIKNGTNYGWPYCYQLKDQIYKDTSKTWQHNFNCATVPLAFAPLQPHSAPLGLEYFSSDFIDPVLRNSFLVAEHGSGQPNIGTGYALALVSNTGNVRNFITGFLKDGKRQARPVDLLMADNKSFFFSDDLNGAIYYVRHK